MAYGQGASASLPICAAFIKNVLSDSSLGYSDTEQFDMPEGFDPCGTSFEMGGDDTEENMGLDNLNADVPLTQ